jgi:drug/metabolite transporter (DMT)-like permease
VVLEVVVQTKVDPKYIEISTGILAAFVGLIFAVWHAIGQESVLMVLASAFVLVSVYIVISFEYLHWSYVIVAFVGAISIIVAALVLDRLTHKKRALS